MAAGGRRGRGWGVSFLLVAVRLGTGAWQELLSGCGFSRSVLIKP